MYDSKEVGKEDSSSTPIPVPLLLARPPKPTLFPYTTLFRSRRRQGHLPEQLVRPGSSQGGRAGAGRSRCGRAVRGALRRHRRSEEHTSELQSQSNLVCRLLLETNKASSPSFTRRTPNTTTRS